MTYTKNRIIALIIAFSLVFSIFSVMSTNYSYATAKPSKVVGLKWKKASANYGKLTWKKVKGAKKYEVYCGAKDEQGNIEWIIEKKVKKPSCSVGQDQLDTYYYKVRAINGKQKGKFSSKVKTKLPYSYYPSTIVLDYGKAVWHDLAEKEYEVDGVSYYYDYDNVNELDLDAYAYLDALLNLGWKIELKDSDNNDNLVSYALVKNGYGFVFGYDRDERVVGVMAK